MINIITSYPKSGNTWLRFILFNILFNIDDKKFSSKDIEKLVPDFHKIIKDNSKLILDENLFNQSQIKKLEDSFFEIIQKYNLNL